MTIHNERSIALEPSHHGLQHCLDRAKERPEKNGLLFRYYVDDWSCGTAYQKAANDSQFSPGARVAFTRLHASEAELERRLRLLTGNEPEDDVMRLYAPRLAAAHELDRFMPEIQRISTSSWHPEAAAPPGPVAPVR